MDMYEAHNWILGIINSCTNYHHRNSCTQLIKNYLKLYGNRELATALMTYLHFKN